MTRWLPFAAICSWWLAACGSAGLDHQPELAILDELNVPGDPVAVETTLHEYCAAGTCAGGPNRSAVSVTYERTDTTDEPLAFLTKLADGLVGWSASVEEECGSVDDDSCRPVSRLSAEAGDAVIAATIESVQPTIVHLWIEVEP